MHSDRYLIKEAPDAHVPVPLHLLRPRPGGRQKFSDAALTECPNCGGSLRKVFNAVGVVFKGSGFYRTDNRKAGWTPAPLTVRAIARTATAAGRRRRRTKAGGKTADGRRRRQEGAGSRDSQFEPNGYSRNGSSGNGSGGNGSSNNGSSNNGSTGRSNGFRMSSSTGQRSSSS